VILVGDSAQEVVCGALAITKGITCLEVNSHDKIVGAHRFGGSGVGLKSVQGGTRQSDAIAVATADLPKPAADLV